MFPDNITQQEGYHASRPEVVVEDLVKVLSKYVTCLENVVYSLPDWKQTDVEASAIFKAPIESLKELIMTQRSVGTDTGDSVAWNFKVDCTRAVTIVVIRISLSISTVSRTVENLLRDIPRVLFNRMMVALKHHHRTVVAMGGGV